MNNFRRILTAVSLTVLIAGNGFAASSTPDSGNTKATASTAVSQVTATAPAATAAPTTAAGSAPAPATSTPAPSKPASAPAAPAISPAPASTPAIAAKEQTLKIGYIEMSRIADESASGKAAAATIKARSEKLKAKIEAKEKLLEKQKKAIESKIETMSGAERNAKAKEFQKKVEEYQKMVRSSEAEMQKVQERLTTELFNKIKKAAGVYAKSHGYAAIVEEKGLLFISDAVDSKDVTDEITAALDEKKQKK